MKKQEKGRERRKIKDNEGIKEEKIKNRQNLIINRCKQE